ncbi:MAG: P-loop NTPase [Bacteroidetes bacterium]|nr:P-loop NTPase [Bacteroidota bacterium]
MHEHTSHNDQASALRRLAKNAPRTVSGAPSYCWTVTSGKGGVGKSVFAMNFAVALSEAGRKVLLVDADENLGKLDVMFGVSPKHRIPDILSESVSIADAAIEVRPGLFLLAGSSGSPNYPEITMHERIAFIAAARTSFAGVTDVVFDTGAGIQERVLSYAVAADQVIVVSHYEPVAILDAYAVIKMITAKRSDASLNIVMNKSLSATECDEAAEKLRTAVKHFLSRDVRYLGIVPNDPAVSRSIVAQAPLAVASPASAASLCIRSIAHAISGKLIHEHQQEAVYA